MYTLIAWLLCALLVRNARHEIAIASRGQARQSVGEQPAPLHKFLAPRERNVPRDFKR